MTLKVGMQHRVLVYYQVCSNDDPVLTLTYFMAGSNLVPYAFVWGIRAVAGQHSSLELSFANKTKMFFRAKKEKNHWTVKYRSL